MKRQRYGLHRVQDDPRAKGTWCGVSAIASVTGLAAADIHATIRRVSKRHRYGKTIAGLNYAELLKIIRALGWRYEEFKRPHGNYRLFDFITDHLNDGPYIVGITGHYVAASRGFLCDSFTKEPVPPHEFFRRSVVKRSRFVSKEIEIAPGFWGRVGKYKLRPVQLHGPRSKVKKWWRLTK